METERASRRSSAEALKHAHAMLATQGIRYERRLVDARLPKIAQTYGVAEDAGKILWYIKEQAKFRPQSLDHFWGYVVRTMQFPPFEPASHMRQRNGKTPLGGREWRYLMQIKRYPHTLREHPPDWLDSSLQSSSSFARIYELYVAQARESLHGTIGGDTFVDTTVRPFADTGMPLADADLDGLLARLERM